MANTRNSTILTNFDRGRITMGSKIRLKFLFRLQDILKKRLFEAESNFEEQEIREKMQELDYEIKRTKIGE